MKTRTATHTMEAMMTTTTTAIEQLRTEAGEAGDLAQVALCDRALAGEAAAIAECLAVIAAAAAMDDA